MRYCKHMKQHILTPSQELQEKRRLKAGKLFKQGRAQAEIALRLKVDPSAVSRWHTAWKKNGSKGLRSQGMAGFSSKLSNKDREKLRKAILKGPRAYGYPTDLWNLERIAAIMKKISGITFGHTWTWLIVLSLGFSCQKPQPKPIERDLKAIETWKTQTFPRLKKMGSRKWLSTWVSG